MTPITEEERERFEAHMLRLNACTRLHRQREALGGHYRTTTVQRAWELWQAAAKHDTPSGGERAEVAQRAKDALSTYGNAIWDRDSMSASVMRRECERLIDELAALSQQKGAEHG